MKWTSDHPEQINGQDAWGLLSRWNRFRRGRMWAAKRFNNRLRRARKYEATHSGREYWASRLYRGGECVCRYTKTLTHRLERRRGRMRLGGNRLNRRRR